MQHGEKLYLDADLDVMARQEQRGAMETDEREGLVREYLETLLQRNGTRWNSLSAGVS